MIINRIHTLFSPNPNKQILKACKKLGNNFAAKQPEVSMQINDSYNLKILRENANKYNLYLERKEKEAKILLLCKETYANMVKALTTGCKKTVDIIKQGMSNI